MIACGALVAAAPPAATRAPEAALADAAKRFLAGLTPDQRKQATFTLEDAHRTAWHYVPKERLGLPLKMMTPEQRALGHALLKAALSPAGYDKATQVIGLETVLAAIENNPVRRDHELYFFSIYGTPAPGGTWAFGFEGHHLSLNLTIVKGKVATSPQFFGANPAEVRDGPRRGLRVLAAEEDLARKFMATLDPAQRKEAIFDADAPSEILTEAQPEVKPLPAVGIAAAKLRPDQRDALRALLAAYAATFPRPLADERVAKIEAAGWDAVRFGWAGGLQPGEGHYYRVQGPTFLFEYDNTQNGANHIHTVWRDFAGDFGRDLLREHLKRAH